MKRVKTTDLIGPALDWAVAVAEGKAVRAVNVYGIFSICERLPDGRYAHPIDDQRAVVLSYHLNWAQGGPIIERKRIAVMPVLDQIGLWLAGTTRMQQNFNGATPLIAAMRCYVASKLGDTVEIPDELV